MRYLIAVAIFAICMWTAAGGMAMEKLAWNGREINGWVCIGDELRPKTGATAHNTWVLRGDEIRPKAGATAGNTWVFRGGELKPKTGATAYNTWIIRNGEARPKAGATSANIWKVGMLRFWSLPVQWPCACFKFSVPTALSAHGGPAIK